MAHSQQKFLGHQLSNNDPSIFMCSTWLNAYLTMRTFSTKVIKLILHVPIYVTLTTHHVLKNCSFGGNKLINIGSTPSYWQFCQTASSWFKYRLMIYPRHYCDHIYQLILNDNIYIYIYCFYICRGLSPSLARALLQYC